MSFPWPIRVLGGKTLGNLDFVKYCFLGFPLQPIGVLIICFIKLTYIQKWA